MRLYTRRSSLPAILLLIGACVSLPVESATPPDLVAAVRAHFPRDADLQFRYSLADLNGDGTLDALVYMGGGYCGSGGCNLLIFKGTAGGFTFVSSTTVAHTPVHLLRASSYGWRALTAVVSGGGTQKHNVLLRFNGAKYPANCSTAPAAVAEDLVGWSLIDFQD